MKYVKPKISSRRIKLSYFMSRVSIVDQFNILADDYAQSGGGNTQQTAGWSTNDGGTGTSQGNP